METIMDVLFHSLDASLSAGKISQEQYAEACTYLKQLKG